MFQIHDSEEDLRVVTSGFLSGEIFGLSFIFFRLVLRFPSHKGRFDLLFPLQERQGGGRGRRSLSRLLKSKMAAVSHRNSMDRDSSV